MLEKTVWIEKDIGYKYVAIDKAEAVFTDRPWKLDTYEGMYFHPGRQDFPTEGTYYSSSLHDRDDKPTAFKEAIQDELPMLIKLEVLPF